MNSVMLLLLGKWFCEVDRRIGVLDREIRADIPTTRDFSCDSIALNFSAFLCGIQAR